MSQGPRFLFVIDFEATCDDSVRLRPQEIIEFPCVVVDINSQRIVHEFQSYVRPVVHPQLTPFCTQLTGITQDRVQNAPIIQTVLSNLIQDLTRHGFLTADGVADAIVVTCGDWDLNRMLPQECKTKKMRVPSWLHSWANIKVIFREWYSVYRPGHRENFKVMGMTSMLDLLELPLIGRHHSGIDDARNIAAIAIFMMQNGARFRVTQSIS